MKSKIKEKITALKYVLRYDTILLKPSYKLRYIIKILINLLKFRCQSIIFIHTSKAEERIFKQLFLNKSVTKTNLSLFSTELEIPNINTIPIKIFHRDSTPLIRAILYPKHITTVICLDHQNQTAHNRGSELILLFNNLGIKTICLQHGGGMTDNLIGHTESASKINILWGEYHFRKIKEISKSDNTHKYYIAGNPLHDGFYKIINEKKDLIIRKNSHDNRKTILIATCLHSEYNDRFNASELYNLYIKTLLESIDIKHYYVVIKMHPNDSLNPNRYLQNIPDYYSDSDFKCYEPTSSTPSIYELIYNCDILISRASTVVEEGVIINKKCIIYDLFEDGPSKHLNYLNTFPKNIRFCYSKKSLKNSLNDIEFILSSNNERNINKTAEKDFTLKLDGLSTQRTWNLILKTHTGRIN